MYGNRPYRAPYNNGGSYGRGSGQGYSRDYSGGGNYQRRPAKKHSGCGKKTIDAKTGVVLYGWRLAKGMMYKMYATPYAGTKISTSKSGKQWANYFVRLINTSTGEIVKTSGLLNLSNHKLYIKELNLVANPSAPNGGYFGKHISKRY